MLTTLLCGLLAVQGEVRAGFGAADITPEPGAVIPGHWKPLASKGVLDPIFATACVISDGRTPLAIVGVDTLFIGAPVVKRARERIAKNTPIPGAHVLVAASHITTGGPLHLCHGVEPDPAYQDRVADAIAKAVGDAWAALKPVEVGIGLGKEATISFNRRFLMKDGREITHPGKPGTPHHSKIVRPAGPVDPDLGLLAVRSPGGAVSGVVVNFSCHGTVVGGDRFSADYPGALRKHLKAAYGDAVQVVFLNGACGDITQVDNLAKSGDFGPALADRMGSKLAAEAVRVIGGLTWMTTLSTGVAVETVPVKIRPEPDVDAERPAFGLGSGMEEHFAAERQRIARERAATPVLDCEVQGLRIGPLGIAAHGGAAFAEYGLRLKQASPHAFTWFAGMANEYLGYVPTPQALLTGGFETRTSTTSKLEIDGGQKLLEGGLRVLQRLAAK